MNSRFAAAAAAALLLACGPRREATVRSDSLSATSAAATPTGDSAAPAPAPAPASTPAAPGGVLAHYDLTAAPAWDHKLPKGLEEISGLAFSPDGRLFAHGDQDATIWQLDATGGKVIKTFGLAPTGHEPDMGKKAKKNEVAGDFEDIQIVGDRFFLISSTGTLLEFKEGGDGSHVPYTARETGLGAFCEIEGMTYDPGSRALLILCKHPHRKEWKDQVVISAWYLDRNVLSESPLIRVDYAKLAGQTHAPLFHGSAMALSPDHNSLVLIAGPQKTFAELALDGTILSAGMLDAASHKQPEGIAFAPDGTLLISDEGAGKRATLSGYARKR